MIKASHCEACESELVVSVGIVASACPNRQCPESLAGKVADHRRCPNCGGGPSRFHATFQNREIVTLSCVCGSEFNASVVEAEKDQFPGHDVLATKAWAIAHTTFAS